MKDSGKTLILVIPPKREQGQTTPFTADHFDMLADVVDYFSLMPRGLKYIFYKNQNFMFFIFILTP